MWWRRYFVGKYLLNNRALFAERLLSYNTISKVNYEEIVCEVTSYLSSQFKKYEENTYSQKKNDIYKFQENLIP